MKNYGSRNKQKKNGRMPEISSKMLENMGDLIFESVGAQTTSLDRELRVPANLFFRMLETIKVDRNNRQFVRQLKEYTMLITVDVSNILIDNLIDIENLYFELSNVIYTICNDRENIEKNRPVAMELMDLYPFIGEVVRNHGQLLIYSERLPKNIWE